MSDRIPDPATVGAAIAMAARAPSIHNSQPWMWTMRDTSLHLTAVRERWLPATDPMGRDILLSCGAAIDYAQVAFARLGWATHVHLMPAASHPDRLAALGFRRSDATERDIALGAAIHARRSDRRPYSSRTVTAGEWETIRGAAQRPGVHLVLVEPGTDRTTVDRLIRRATDARGGDPVWGVEQRAWIGPESAPGVGVPTMGARRGGQLLGRRVGAGAQQGLVCDDGGVDQVVLVATDGDSRRTCLDAGRATSELLLAATAAGLATCVLSLVVEVGETREELRRTLLADAAEPQLLVRIGWAAAGSEPLPPTPRLRLDEILRYAPGLWGR